MRMTHIKKEKTAWGREPEAVLCYLFVFCASICSARSFK